MSAEITAQTADAVEREILAAHHLVLAYKGGPLWDAVGAALDVLRALGVGVPSGKDFNERYATTILGVIAMPRMSLTPTELVLLLVHEATHGVQWQRDPARMPIWADSAASSICARYLQHREKRASYEAGAIAQAMAVHWALTGSLPARVEDLPSALVYGYDLTPADRQLAQDELEQEATAIARGVIPMGPARTALGVISRAQPDALDAGAAALIRAHSPGVLE